MSKSTKKLLTEGGVAGHLMHLYDNPDMTASQMTQILTSAANGELVGTEKTDGFNIYLSFIGGQARYARNKGDMRKGGGSMQDLIAREFAGGEKIKKVYLDAFGSFERAMQSLSPESRQQLFGGESPIFLNTEIQGPGANNLVNYDANILSIHATGHKYYDAQSDTVINADSSAVSRIANHLDTILDQMEEINAGLPFSVKRTAVMRLQGITDGTALEDVLYRINQAGFTGDMTIAEYIDNKLSPIIQRSIPSATGDLLGHIIDHIKQKKGRKNVRIVRKSLAGPEEGEALTALLDRRKQLLNDAIAPIEEAIHDFAVELLRGVESAYILDNRAEMERVRTDVADAIEQIAAYDGPGSDEAQEILIKQLKKIKSHENITSAVEGFVFSWDGQTYKFTGNFAPANQILGLFKYGRGSAPPIARKESSEEPSEPINEAEATPPAADVEPVRRKVAVIPGGFKSPHRGHFAMARKYSGMVDKVIVFVSPLSRPTPSGDEITSEDSVQLWNEYINAYDLQDKIDVKVSTINSPVRLVFDFVANGWDNRKEKQVNEPNPDYAHAGDLVILGVSTKGGDDSRFTATAQQYAHPHVRVAAGREYAIAAEGSEFVHSQTGEALSASHMRACEDSPEAEQERMRLGLDKDPLKALAEFLPTRLRNDVARIHSSLFQRQEMAAEGLVELVGSLLMESYIEEISAMAGGAVEGAPGQKKKKKKQDTLIREDEEDFEPHMMYDPKTGEGIKAKTYKDHVELDKKGWVHEKPDLEESEKKNCGCGQDPCITYGTQNENINDIAKEGKSTGAGQQNKDREEGYPLGGKKNKKNQDTIIREDEEEEISEACGDEDETWRASGERGPSKINTLDYVERGPPYEMGDDVQPPTSPDERLDADPWPPPIPKMPHKDEEQLDILRRLVQALGRTA